MVKGLKFLKGIIHGLLSGRLGVCLSYSSHQTAQNVGERKVGSRK